MRGDRLRALRESANLTQEEFGNIIGASEPTILRYEKNQYPPSADVIFRMAQHFNVSADYLLGLTDNPSVNIDHDVRLVSVTQAIDLSGVMGQMIAGVLFAFAEMELVVSKERQAAGIAAAKPRGVYTGRKSGTTKAAPARARALREQGLKIDEIAAALQISKRTVASYLRA